MREKLLPLWLDKKNRYLLIGFFTLGLLLLFFQVHEKVPAKESISDPVMADTVIPKGFVLVPVEIQNMETIASMVGEYGIVDLFTTPQLQQKGGIRVAKHIRLIRAPLNPQSYAVLVPENEAHDLLAAVGPYTAVIQNPENQEPAEIVKKHVQHSLVEYFKGGFREK